MNFLNTFYAGNPFWRWALVPAIAVVTFVGLLLFRKFVTARVSPIMRRTSSHLDDVVVSLFRRTRPVFLAIFSLWLGLLAVTLPDRVRDAVQTTMIVFLFVQAAFWGNALLRIGLDRSRQTLLARDPDSATTLGAVGTLVQVVLWAVAALLILDNMGIQITGLVAGLGIGGIAAALALQTVFKDLFGSFAILLDRPFVVGDFIVVGDNSGTVERIGLKTTRLRSVDGEQLVISNSDLLDSRIRNFKRMSERRVQFNIQVPFGTPLDRVELVPALLREIVQEQPRTRVDRVHLKSCGPAALVYEVAYFVETADYNFFMDTQQSINLAMLARFEEEGIEFALPHHRLPVEEEEGERRLRGRGETA